MTIGRPHSSAPSPLTAPPGGGAERSWSIRRTPGGEVHLTVWAARKPLDLEAALGWFAEADRDIARSWFLALLHPEPAPQPLGLTVRAVAGPLTGALVRFVPDPGPPIRGPLPGQAQISGHYLDFLTQLRPMRQALGFIDHPRLGTWMLDVASGALDLDESWAALVGHNLADLLPFTHDDWVALTEQSDAEGFAAPEVQEALQRGEVVQYVSRSRHAKGHWVWLLCCCRGAAWGPDGRLLRIIGYDIDITEHRELLAEAEEQRRLMQHLLDVMPSGQVVLDEAGRVTFLNPEAAELLATPPDQAIGQVFLDLMALESGAEALATALANRSRLRDLALVQRRPLEAGLDAGVRHLMSTQASPEFSRRRHLTVSATHVAQAGKTFLSLTDVTDHVAARRNLEQAVEQARYIATHDLMTGLPDRYAFLRHLSEVFQASERGQTSFAVMMIDLDDFKLINDGMGHEVGDQLLKAAATRLARGLPDRARLARFGGDEFVLVVPDCSPAEAALLADDLRGRFATPLDFSRRNSTISCSIGIGIHPFDARSPEGLLRAADLAMYEAKAMGRGQIRRFSVDLSRRNERRNAVRHALQRALSQGGFQIVLQPKFDLGNLARPIGAEVLVRLTDAELGALSPAEFIPVAETHDLVPAIDREVVAMVGALRRAWALAGIELPLAINLSALTLSGAGFGDLLETLPELAAGGGLMIEVTETSLIGRLSEVRETLRLLQSAGVGVAIDDFGVGHSSLAYLQSLPIRELKIDRSFVAGLGPRGDGPSPAIVRAILALAEAMGLETVAEGIETTDQANWLIDHGCTQAQGFLLGRPVSPDEFERIYLGQPVSPAPRSKPDPHPKPDPDAQASPAEDAAE